MKPAEVIALVVAMLGLAGAFQGFASVDLLWKLIALAIAGGLLLSVSALRLNAWVNVVPRPGFVPGNHSRSKARVAATIASLGMICIGFMVIAWLILWFYAINVESRVGPGDRISIWVQGANQLASKLTIQVPPRSQSKCEPVDSYAEAGRRTKSLISDWESANPELQLSDFAYPQRQGVSCSPQTKLDRFILRVEPPIEVLFPERRLRYTMIILSLGGVLWIVSIFFALRRSR